MAAVFYDNFSKLGEEGYMLLSILGFLFCFCSCIEVLYLLIYKTLHSKHIDRATRTPLKPGMNSGAPEGLSVPVLQSGDTRRVTFEKHVSYILLSILS
jgi:hypothetical protein